MLTDSHGRLLAVGPDQAVPSSPLIRSEHFSRAVLLPGLVNTHTHLELTGLEGQAPESDFAEWIRAVIRLKAARPAAEFRVMAREGVRAAHQAGVTTVADTGDTGTAFDALLEAGGSGIAYLEIFGPDPALAERQLEEFRARVIPLLERQTARVRLGLSPHAPYSVSGPLYRKVAALAEELDLPLAVHVAESEAESLLLESGDGAFAAQWTARGIPLPSLPGTTPVQWLDRHGVLGPRTLCIHAIRVSGEDIATLAGRQAAVAHCPRSNRRHGHGDAPLRRLLDAAIRIGVGTDSVASVHPPDLLAEARAAAALGGVSAEASLDLVMAGAARAIGLEHDIGTLTPGKYADMALLNLREARTAEMIPRAILESNAAQVQGTWIAGREVYRR